MRHPAAHGEGDWVIGGGEEGGPGLISLDEPNAVPIYDIYAQIAYSLKGSDVETVVIGGRVVMRERKLLTVDEARVLEKAWEYGKSGRASLGME